MKNYYCLCIALFLLISCSENQVKKDASFNQQSPTGIVVFGVTLKTPFPNPTVQFRRYDAVTGNGLQEDIFSAQPEGSNFKAGFSNAVQIGEHSYFVLNMPAGNWFLDCINAGSSDNHSLVSLNTCLASGTVAFVVKPGEATYIGEYAISSGDRGGLGISKLSNNFEVANEKMKEYKNINVSLEFQAPQNLTHECVKKMVWVNKFECDASRMNAKVSAYKK